MRKHVTVWPLVLVVLLTACGLTAGQRPLPTNEKKIKRVIDVAEAHFVAGKALIAKNDRGGARKEFNSAVDSILSSGIDARTEPGLQRYYLELVERIYRIEIPNSANEPIVTSGVGFLAQDYVPAPSEPLAVVFDAPKRDRTGNQPCQLSWIGLPTLRGFGLGRNGDQLKLQLKDLWARKLSENSDSDARTYHVELMPVFGAKPHTNSTMEGIRGFELTWMDGLLASYTIKYQSNGVNWYGNIKGLAAKFGPALHLPESAWQFAEFGDTADMECADFTVSIRDVGGPVLTVQIFGLESIVRQRHGLAEQNRRKDFKP